MQLIRILLVAVSIVVLLSGVSIFFGSTKREKSNAARFLLATFGAAFWTISIDIFIKMPQASPEQIHAIVCCIIGGVALCDVGLLAYLGWPYKNGKIATILFALIGIGLTSLLIYDSSLFYTSFDLNQEYTHLDINKGWYYFSLIAYFFLISITFSLYLQKRIRKTTNKGLKTGLKVFYVGLSISGILSLIFSLVLISTHPHLTWIGPMATTISVLAFYYSVVKFRTISMSSKWMEVMSYAILVAFAGIIYLLAFYIVFTALFGVPNPSTEVLALNVIMAAFLLLLMPTFTELASFMRANFYSDKIDLGYITKKLERIDKNSFDPKDTVKFLSDCMHYSYITLIINGHVYSSDNSRFSATDLEYLARLKPTDQFGWISKTDLSSVSRVAILTNKSGQEIGKIVFGDRHNDSTLSRRDLIKHNAIVGILSTLVEENHKK